MEASNHIIAALIFIASAVVVFLAVRRIVKGHDSMIYVAALSTVTAILVSFHGLVYDLTLLAPILFFLLSRSLDNEPKIDTHTILLLILLCLTPLYVFLLLKVDSFAYFSLILLWLFARLLLTPAPAKAPA